MKHSLAILLLMGFLGVRASEPEEQEIHKKVDLLRLETQREIEKLSAKVKELTSKKEEVIQAQKKAESFWATEEDITAMQEKAYDLRAALNAGKGILQRIFSVFWQ